MNRSEISMYDASLREIDKKIPDTPIEEIPSLFKNIPLQIFGYLTLLTPDEYPNIKNFFPAMPSEQIQRQWNGSSGERLLEQSITFVDSVVQTLDIDFSFSDLAESKLLDFGCGWGRLLRLFYKFIPTTQLYGVDAWDISLQHCMNCKIKAKLAKIDEICTSIPFQEKFDIVISFSVFTHLSERASSAALKALRDSINDRGVLIVTIRPKEFIPYFLNNRKDIKITLEKIEELYNQIGFVYFPQNREPFDGDITFGDTFISIDYINRSWREWEIVKTLINKNTPFQRLLFLRPR